MCKKIKNAEVVSVRKTPASDRATDGSEAAKLDLGSRGREEAMAILSLSLYNLVKDRIAGDPAKEMQL